MTNPTQGRERLEGTVAEFYDKLGKGVLSASRCRMCDALRVPPTTLCPICYKSKLDVVRLSGRGTLKTFTVVHIAPPTRSPLPLRSRHRSAPRGSFCAWDAGRETQSGRFPHWRRCHSRFRVMCEAHSEHCPTHVQVGPKDTCGATETKPISKADDVAATEEDISRYGRKTTH